MPKRTVNSDFVTTCSDITTPVLDIDTMRHVIETLTSDGPIIGSFILSPSTFTRLAASIKERTVRTVGHPSFDSVKIIISSLVSPNRIVVCDPHGKVIDILETV